MSAMDPVIIIEVIHGSQKIANYTLDGYLCHIAIPAHAQLPKMDCPVRYDQGNYAVLHYIHSVRLYIARVPYLFFGCIHTDGEPD